MDLLGFYFRVSTRDFHIPKPEESNAQVKGADVCQSGSTPLAAPGHRLLGDPMNICEL